MKGFMRKDLYLTLRYCRSIFLIFGVFAVIGVMQENNFFFILYPAIMVSLVSVSLLSYDEREHFCAYAATTPPPRSAYVSAKYLIGLAYGMICIVFITLLQFLSGNFTGKELVYLICVLFFLVLLTPSVTLPFMFRFGVEKGRMVYYFMIGISTVTSFLIKRDVMAQQQYSEALVFLIFILFAVVLFIGSWKLSVRCYSKHEF